MPIVPSGDVVKFVAVGTPYSPVNSFNPDKKEMFQTHTTNLGLLEGNCTTDGVNVTVPSGTTFVQNGIICRLTNAFVVAIPAVAFPKRVVADLTNENPGSPVTIQIQADPVPASQVILASLTPNDSTIVVAKKVSIRGIHDRIEALGAGISNIDILKSGVAVKVNADEINFTGGNVAVTDGGANRGDVAVNLDIKNDAGTTISSNTKEIRFTGDPTVTLSAANSVTVDIPKLVTKDEGVVVVTQTQKINFIGAGVTAAVDGGDATQANVTITSATIPATASLDQQISHNGALVVGDAEDWDFEDAGPGSLGILWTITDVGGSPKRGEIRGFYLDCCTWHECQYGTFAAANLPPNAVPGPEVISPPIYPVSYVLDETLGTGLEVSGVASFQATLQLNGNSGGNTAVTGEVQLLDSAPSTTVLATETALFTSDLETVSINIPYRALLNGLTSPFTIRLCITANSSDGGNPGTPARVETGPQPIVGLTVQQRAMGTALMAVMKIERTGNALI